MEQDYAAYVRFKDKPEELLEYMNAADRDHIITMAKILYDRPSVIEVIVERRDWTATTTNILSRTKEI